MNYCIISAGIITNIIVCADDNTAASLCAVPSYDGACIGDSYQPPPEPEPEPTEVEVLQAQVAELQAELLRLRTGG